MLINCLVLLGLLAVIAQVGAKSLQLKPNSRASLTKRDTKFTSLLSSLFSSKVKAQEQEYDYIIVGGGTAGCVLANRLSADGNKKVLVLEAGSGDYKNSLFRIPAGIIKLFKTKYDWNYDSHKEPGANNRDIYLCRGKVLGGSSSLNVLLYHRGSPVDYDSWVEATEDKSWSADAVLPYFKKSEHDQILQDKKSHRNSKYHNTGGELGVSQVRYQNVLSKTFLQACAELQCFSYNEDFNDWSVDQAGYGRYDVTQYNGERSSGATAFLEPALRRNKKNNLQVLTNTYCRKVLFNDQKEAIGVEVEINGKIETIKLSSQSSSSEIILSGGAINSPQILMLSGIGCKEHLQEHHIPCIVDLPGVGQNLQDHPAAVVSYRLKDKYQGHTSVTSKLRIPYTKFTNPLVLLNWLFFKRGLLTSVGCDHGGFFRTNSNTNDQTCDLQMRFLPAQALSADGMATYTKFRESTSQPDGVSFQSIVARPFSRGYVKLRNDKPNASPLISTGYFTDTDGKDIATMREGIKLARKMANTKVFEGYLAEEVFPGKNIQTDEQIDAYIRDSVHTSNAIVGTCGMGRSTDPHAVVDRELKVFGVSRLRVIDASVMPRIIGGQTSAPTIMIAERASDLLLK